MANTLDAVGAELERSPLYVHPEAEGELTAEGADFDEGAQDDVRARLEDTDTPFYVAVLPTEMYSDNVDDDLQQAVGNGTFFIIFPSQFLVRAPRRYLRDIEALAGQQLDGSGGDLGAAITGFVDEAEQIIAGDGGGGDGSSGDGGSSGGGGLLPLAILAAAGGGGFLLYRRNKRNKERVQLEQARTALDEDITAYGEQLSSLDLDLRADSEVPAAARSEYGRALDLYEQAKTFADRAERPGDLKPVTHALEEGRWLLGCVEARLSNQPLPERRLPCFFDPRHGPSTEDIEWAPPGGVPRVVPACAADAIRIKDGAEPDVRMVPGDDGERRPYWDAGPAYGGWAGGYFGGFLPGMLMGTMLGSAFSSPMYADPAAGDAGGDGFDGGGGDWGGFDGGGGDWGGFDGGGGDW